MRSKSLLLAVAGICGTIAAVGTSKWMHAQGGVEKQQTAEIFVTVQDIEIGEQFTAENVRLEAWPLDRIPEGSMQKLEQIEGKFTNQRLYAGEPLISRKISETAGNTRRDIPRDYSVVSLQTDPATSMATLIEPGDRVNVMGFFKKGEVIPQTMTQKVLTGIRVYAVDGRKTRTEGEAISTPARSVSLLIHKRDEEAWTYANELGRIRLSLSHPDEYDNRETSDGSDVAGQEFLKWIADYGKREAEISQPAAAVAQAAPAPENTEQALRMTKMSGGMMTVYEMQNGIWVVVQSSDADTETSPTTGLSSPPAQANTMPGAGTGTGANTSTGPDDYSYLNGSGSPFFEAEPLPGNNRPVGAINRVRK